MVPRLTKENSRTLASQLLAYAAADLPSDSLDQQFSWDFEGVNEGQFDWVINAGLGPLLYRGTRGRPNRFPDKWQDRLTSAHLTAQIRYGNLVDTANEIIDICTSIQASVTLLKGISTSDQFYPAGYLRPMGDIDILVSGDAYPAVESSIIRGGYSKSDEIAGKDHGPPLFHPGRRVWVEVHTALFDPDEDLQRNGLFSPAHIDARSVASTFHDRRVKRLADEMQLIYISSSWMRDVTKRKVHPSFMASLFDAIYLLRLSRSTLDWDRLLGWLNNEMAMASLYVTLTYLARRGLSRLPPSVISRLATGQPLVGAMQVRAIHGMLDHYLIGCRPWNLVFPPPVPGRYSLRYQWNKRIATSAQSTLKRPCGINSSER